MKKFLFFCLMAFVTSVNANAEKIVGHYHQGSKKYNVTALYKNDLCVYIQVDGKYETDKVFIRIEGTKNIQYFINALNICKTKYIEWDKVAKSNNITDFEKTIDVNFPNVIICWNYFDTKWCTSKELNYIKPYFSVCKNINFIIISGIAKYWDNEYIDTFFYMLLTPNNIDELINALNIDNINLILKQETKIDALFQ